jgi:hypothetical protein
VGISVHRAGAGVVANPDVLVDWIETDDPIPPDVHAEHLVALVEVCRLWRALGVIDSEDRLTPLGVWGGADRAARRMGGVTRRGRLSTDA